MRPLGVTGGLAAPGALRRKGTRVQGVRIETLSVVGAGSPQIGVGGVGSKRRGRRVGYWGCGRFGVLKQVASPNSSSEQVLWVLSKKNWAAPLRARGPVSW